MNSKLNQWVLMSCVAMMLAGGAAPARADISDAWITTRVKMMLMSSSGTSGISIDVDTDEGRVTLYGKVPSDAERTEAERVTHTGAGVVSVRNLLQVVPASRRHSVDIVDSRLQTDINAALASEPGLVKSSIRAKSVDKGVVLLAGKAATLSDHLLALEVTSAFPGVRKVASAIESPDEFGDREVWSDDAPSAPAHGNAVTDGWITAQTKLRFMTDADVPSSEIHVDTRRGVVTLFGTVPSATVSDHAVHVTRDVSGVRSVTNELRVVSAARLEEATAHDDVIASSVRERISDAKMEGANVQVDVKAATAHLTGSVQLAAQRYAAVAIAHATPGVVRVQNDLRIEGPQTSQR